MKKLCFLLVLIMMDGMVYGQDRITGRSFATRSDVIAQNGIAATSHPLATQIALDILKDGGNAVDAAIAANAALGLMEPTGNGIGGDIFAIIWDARTKQLYGLNGSGRSPRDLSLQYFKENKYESIPSHGPLPVSVPGTVDGWFEMHQRFGSMPMENILNPTIKYAEEGFPVTELIAYYLQRSASFMDEYPNFSDVYMPGGKAPETGQVFKNPQLANTLRAISTGGRDAFYKGDIARTMANFIKEQGGFLSYEDLATHTSDWVDPVSVNYRGVDLWELPPSGQGIAALQVLQILEAYDFDTIPFASPTHVHLFTEAKKLAFEDRAKYYADPDFADVPTQELISDEYAARRRELINPKRAARTYDAGKLEQGNTIYLTVADKEGNMVSLIQSNYRGMGSGMVPPGLGFMLQDRGEMFSLEEGHANVFEPGKRPFHTIIPAFITKDGKPWVSFGLMGGAMQPQGHAQIVMNLVDFKMGLQEAGDAPRIHHEGSSEPTGYQMTDGGILQLESGFSYDTIRELMHMGHNVGFTLGVFGGYQAIMYDEEKGVYFGASESRKDGQAAGY